MTPTQAARDSQLALTWYKCRWKLLTTLVLSEARLVTKYAGAGLKTGDNEKLQSLVCDPLTRTVEKRKYADIEPPSDASSHLL